MPRVWVKHTCDLTVDGSKFCAQTSWLGLWQPHNVLGSFWSVFAELSFVLLAGLQAFSTLLSDFLFLSWTSRLTGASLHSPLMCYHCSGGLGIEFSCLSALISPWSIAVWIFTLRWKCRNNQLNISKYLYLFYRPCFLVAHKLIYSNTAFWPCHCDLLN